MSHNFYSEIHLHFTWHCKEWVKKHIQNQRAHHAAGKTQDRLERITEDETALSPKEEPGKPG